MKFQRLMRISEIQGTRLRTDLPYPKIGRHLWMFPEQEAKKEFGNPEILPYPIFTMYVPNSLLQDPRLSYLNLAVLFIMIILGFLICIRNFST